MYRNLTTAACPCHKKPTPLGAKVAEVALWAVFWTMFYISLILWWTS